MLEAVIFGHCRIGRKRIELIGGRVKKIPAVFVKHLVHAALHHVDRVGIVVDVNDNDDSKNYRAYEQHVYQHNAASEFFNHFSAPVCSPSF